MKVVLQRVKKAEVAVNEEIVGSITDGFVVFLGITHTDTEVEADKLKEKILKLRLFSGEGSESFMEQSVVDIGGACLVVSQFTLYGNCKKGTKPSFTDAARPEHARPLYEYFVETLKESGLSVATGQFGEHMEVSLINDGPVTLILES